MGRKLVNLPTCADALGVPISWLKDNARAGHIPCLKVGGKFLFDLEAAKTAVADMASQRRNSRRGTTLLERNQRRAGS